MSSSKGKGSSAREIADLLPTKIFRLALLGKDINQQFNFDPEGDTIPVLYDQYDKLAESYWAGVKDDYARLFEFIHETDVDTGENIALKDVFLALLASCVSGPNATSQNFRRGGKDKGSAFSTEEEVEIAERASMHSGGSKLCAREVCL
jgi:lysyl-tRNA synthetase class I